jgi:hypothetical protein
MSHVNYIGTSTNQIAHFVFAKIVVRRFASHIFDTFNKKWRQMKPKQRQENGQTWIFFFIDSPFWICIKKTSIIHFLVHGHSSWFIFGVNLMRDPRLSKQIFYEVGP